MEKSEIKGCFNDGCPFFNTTIHGHECNHPYWYDKDPYENLIIERTFQENYFPKKCPYIMELKKEKPTH